MHISSYNGQKVLALLWTASLTSLILPAPSTSVAISATPALQLRASSVVGMLNSGDMGKFFAPGMPPYVQVADDQKRVAHGVDVAVNPRYVAQLTLQYLLGQERLRDDLPSEAF
ncbi:hypothetical protein FB107DRAFT_280757 [Schizophyllum commune]